MMTAESRWTLCASPGDLFLKPCSVRQKLTLRTVGKFVHKRWLGC